jgi:hypothetical protein
MNHWLCLLNPGTCVVTSVAKSTMGDLFDALTAWILGSVQWFLASAGHVLNSASDPTVVLRSASQEFNVLLTLSAPLMLLGLLVSTFEALRRGDSAALWRTYLGVAPAAVLAIALARPIAMLILQAVDQLSSSASSTVVVHERSLATSLMTLATSTPGFGLFILAVGVVIGTWLLWCELIVRSVVLTLLLVLVPIIVPLVTFPGARRVAARLAETFIAVAVSKFLIVITLSLGLDELTGSSSTQVITGAVTLMLAAGTPFLLLKIIPLVERSAMHNLEGVRSRFTRTGVNLATSPAVGLAQSLLPDVAVPGPPERPEDLGLAMWDSSSEVTMPPVPPIGAEPMPPPIGEPKLRGGHVAYRLDDKGPVVGWHFDD